MKAALVILLGLSVLTLAGIMIQPTLTLRVTTGEDIPVICTRVNPGEMVTLEFTHSMFGGYVRERYRLSEDGTLERQQIVAGNAAAAEYYATDGRTREGPDGYEVLGPPFATNDLVVRIDERGDHWLTIGMTRYHLADILPGSTQVHIRGDRTAANQMSCP